MKARKRSPKRSAPAPNAPAPNAGAHHMWGGRFAAGPEQAFDQLNRSLPVDIRLWPQDVQGSQAWVQALKKAGVLAADEPAKMTAGLYRVGKRLEAGAADGAGDEDVHTLVERFLYEEVGDLAGKLHSGRSRNDQVATDFRLWCLEAITRIDNEVTALGRTLVEQAR